MTTLKDTHTHTHTHAYSVDSCRRRIGPCYRPLSDNHQHSEQTSMPPTRFEPTIPTRERPQTHALDRAITKIHAGFPTLTILQFSSLPRTPFRVPCFISVLSVSFLRCTASSVQRILCAVSVLSCHPSNYIFWFRFHHRINKHVQS